MKTFNKKDLSLAKIKTGVPGFDDLFYGGLRLPNNEQQDGLCIVIYGERGVSKSDFALQIMRGVDRYFKTNPNAGMVLSPRFCSLTHRESELEKHYRGAEVVDMIDFIKAPEKSVEPASVCRLCSCFKDLVTMQELSPVRLEGQEGCGPETIKECAICKQIRHGVIVYNSRSQSLHWNVGGMSDEDNFLSFLPKDAIDTTGIFEKQKEDDKRDQEEWYEKTPLQVLNDFREEVFGIVRNREKAAISAQQGETERHFTWSTCVIEGFTAFSDDDLTRLPFADLIRLLRKTSAVSILVFDERGADLHLNADILLHMTKSEDPKSAYQFQQMHIVKSDCQPHVRGWHKYRTVYGMKVIVYPSIPYLLMPRFEIDNAVPQLEHESLFYPQSLLHKFQFEYVREQAQENANERAKQVLKRILSSKEGAGEPFDKGNLQTSVALVEDETPYDQLYNQIREQVSSGETTVVVFLLGKTEQSFRQFISDWQYSREALRNIHCWEATSAYVWPEMFASVVKQYISRWKRNSQQHHLHIVIDDFANIGLYPLMRNEPLLPYALANICRNATVQRGFEGNDRGVRITLSMVCRSKRSAYYQTLCQLTESINKR